MRTRNIILSIFFCLSLVGPIGLLIFESYPNHLDLPDWLTSRPSEYLSGSQERKDISSMLKVKFVKSKELQDAIEADLGNSIPMKSDALLLNSSIQRTAIQASNAIFDYPAYPTFYGSEYYYLVNEDALSAEPWTKSSINMNNLKSFGEKLNLFASKHEDVDFITMLVNDTKMQSSNPVMKLANNMIDPNGLTNDFRNAIIEEGICEFLNTDVFDSMEDYYSEFYKSDHHWSARGASKAANEILASMGKDASDTGVTEVEGPLYSGAYARSSLCMIEDIPLDIDEDYGEVLLEKNSEQENGNQHLAYHDAPELSKHYQFYDLYYQDFAESNGPGEGRILLVSDSYGYALIRPLAKQCETVFSVSDLHSQEKSSNKNLGELIADNDIDTVVFVGHIGNYSNFMKKHPEYFS